MTLGIRPDWPCPGYGYIERGGPAEIPGYEGSEPVVEVESFREKPDPELAAQFLEKGNFSWNAGIFIWSIPTLIRELEKQCPELAGFIGELRLSDNFSATVADKFPALEKISIDYALMENAGRVLNIEADVGWDDVGGWPSLSKYLDQDEEGNSVRGDVISVGAKNNIVFNSGGDQKVALLGVEDLIVVRTGDSILVANRKDADKIKALVDRLPDDLK